MKKRFFSVILAIFIITSTVTGCTEKTNENEVTIPKEEYDKLVDNYKKYSKAEYLQEQIHNEFIDEISEEDLIEGVYHGIFESLDDKYSTYMDAEEFKKYMEVSSGTYYGIGVRIGSDEMNLIHIYDFTASETPAMKAGLKINDQIIKVNDKEYTGEQLEKAIEVMKSTEKEGTVKITVRRVTGEKIEILDFDVEREEIRYIESIQSDMINDTVGYIRIVQFDEVAGKDFKEHFKNLEKRGMESYILDLRSNPGGLVNSAVEIADFLLGETIVVYTEDKYGERIYHRSDSKKEDIPFVVLVNSLSASAAEILSGAIQDLEEAPVVGVQTFGKGIVQKVIPYHDGSAYKYTVSKYYTPSGKNIHEIGITPDYIVELPDDIKGIGIAFKDTDVQILKALELLNN